jgi:hypothetical protein
MPSIERLLLPQFVGSTVIRFRSIELKIFNFFMDNLVRHLTILNRILKFIDRHIQAFVVRIFGKYYDDYSIGTTANELFNQNNYNKDYNNPDMHDVFHIYLSQLLYETPERIIEQCINWGFSEGSIEPFHYSQTRDLKKYTYDTQAALIHHKESNTIIIAFRGTQPGELLQWMTDGSTNFIDINDPFNDDDDDDVDNNNNKIRVHAGFYSALGLSVFNSLEKIDFSNVTKETPMFIQLLNSIQKIHQNDNKYNISITGHSLGGGLASLFSFVLCAHGYESSISGVYTYGQPLVGDRRYAEILNKKLGNRIHRWVNHSDIVPRIPVIELPSIAWYYARTPYTDALEEAANDNKTIFDWYHHHYYHSGLRFKIDHRGNLKRDSIDQGPILAYEDRLDIFHGLYAIRNAIDALLHISPLRCISWLIAPVEITDHNGDNYARNIKKIVTKNK